MEVILVCGIEIISVKNLAKNVLNNFLYNVLRAKIGAVIHRTIRFRYTTPVYRCRPQPSTAMSMIQNNLIQENIFKINKNLQKNKKI